jgi:methylmalonyl-CoA mutase, N-terminal domain
MGLYDREAVERVRKQQEEWEKRELNDAMEVAPEREDHYQTVSGTSIERLYTPEDVKDLDYQQDLGMPGAYPFTRGVYPTMYRGRLWTRRQIAGFGTAKSTNQRYKFLLAHGQTGISTDGLRLLRPTVGR